MIFYVNSLRLDYFESPQKIPISSKLSFSKRHSKNIGYFLINYSSLFQKHSIAKRQFQLKGLPAVLPSKLTLVQPRIRIFNFQSNRVSQTEKSPGPFFSRSLLLRCRYREKFVRLFLRVFENDSSRLLETSRCGKKKKKKMPLRGLCSRKNVATALAADISFS